jgi:hypothetical protein
MTIIDELRGIGLMMGTVYENGLHITHTTDEGKVDAARELGAFVTSTGTDSLPSWEVRAYPDTERTP